MLRIREFEERVKRTFEEHPGVIRGHTHLADGAEASIVGSLAALNADDYVLTTYRCHGYPIVLGTDTKAMMAEIYGREDGLCKGYGGSMHLTDVGARLPRHLRHRRPGHSAREPAPPGRRRSAARARSRSRFFGDGASKQGAFHETLNIAALWKLPIVFVMENNSYNVHTRVEQEDANAAAGEPLAVKAQAYSMPGVTVDGGDPVAVYETCPRRSSAPAQARARRSSSRSSTDCPRTATSSRRPACRSTSPSTRRSRSSASEEYEAALRGDPVPRFRARLVDGRGR